MSSYTKPKIPTKFNSILNGKIIASYEVEKYLGKGGNSKCYLIRDVKSGIKYAGKAILKNELLKTKKKIILFDYEVMIHSSLSNHNIVDFIDMVETDKFVILILEYCKHGDIKGLVKLKKRLSEAEIKKYLIQILNSMEYLSGKGVLHRDIKPENMFLDEKLNIKLGDFGMAMFMDEERKDFCGTPNYISPEILTSKGYVKYTIKSDIWSIGVSLYTMAIGKPPFETTNIRTTYRRIIGVIYYYPDRVKISDNLKDLIDSILKISSEERQSLSDIRNNKIFKNSI